MQAEQYDSQGNNSKEPNTTSCLQDTGIELYWWLQSIPSSFIVFWRRSLRTLSLDYMNQSNAASSREVGLTRNLGVVHLTYITVGHMVGAGIFLLLGRVAHDDAGASVILSLILAGILAFFSALTFCELASIYTLSGGAFTYNMATLGEFSGWMTISVIGASAIASGGALARFWSEQLAVLCGEKNFLVRVGSADLDFVAVGITAIAILLVASSTLVTSWINIVLKSALIVIIVIVLTLAFPKAETGNWDPFFEEGADGVFYGAALVFFAYTGYDASCYMAEESVEPEKNVPRSIIGGFLLTFVLYILMACALTLAVDYRDIVPKAPFYHMFKDSLNIDWAAYLVISGTLVAVGTVIMVSFLVTTRQFLAMARYHLIPNWLAKLDSRTSTPLWLTLIFGLIKAVLALTTSARRLAALRSAGFLFVISLVAVAFLWRRFYRRDPEEENCTAWFWPSLRINLLVLVSQGFGASYQLGASKYFLIGLGPAAGVIAFSFFFLDEVQPELDAGVKIVCAPLVGSFVIFGASVLMWQLGTRTVVEFAIILGICALVYLFYGGHAAERHDKAVNLYIAIQEAGGDQPFDDIRRLNGRDDLEELAKPRIIEMQRLQGNYR